MKERYWCWWMSRYLLLIEKTDDGKYIFEDFGDCRFTFTEDEFAKLRKER